MKLPTSNSDGDGTDLTPIIDVVFLLLIFFLVATRFDEQERLVSLNLAEILKAEPIAAGPKELIINVTKEGKFNISDKFYSEGEMADVLKQAALHPAGKRPVQIRSDQDARVKHPLTVVGLCKQYELDYSFTVLEERPSP